MVFILCSVVSQTAFVLTEMLESKSSLDAKDFGESFPGMISGDSVLEDDEVSERTKLLNPADNKAAVSRLSTFSTLNQLRNYYVILYLNRPQ